MSAGAARPPRVAMIGYGLMGEPEATAFVRKLAEITPPAAAFDAAFSTK